MATKHSYIYSDLDEIPVYNFFKCSEGELKYLYSDRKGEINSNIKEVWEGLYDEYCALTSTPKTRRYYELLGIIKGLEKRFEIAPVLINLLLKTPKNSIELIVYELSKWDLKINSRKQLKSEINRIITILNNSKNKYKRYLRELEDLREQTGEGMTLAEQKAKLHRLLGINVDTKSTSVTEWLAYWEEVKLLSNKK